jgi:hypothetical protein
MQNKLIVIFILIIGSIIAYSYMYPNHRSISEEAVSFAVKADYIHEEFIQNSAQAEQKYLDQTLLVSGLVTAIDSQSLTIGHKVYGQFVTLTSDLKVNDSVTVKGRCIGFDDLLEEIKLDQCTIKK